MFINWLIKYNGRPISVVQFYEVLWHLTHSHKVCPSKNLKKVWDTENLCNMKNEVKKWQSPNFFLCPKLFLCFFQKKVGTLYFLPCFLEILISKKHKYRHFSMSKTFSMFYSEKHRKMLGLCHFCLVFLNFLLVKNTSTDIFLCPKLFLSFFET